MRMSPPGAGGRGAQPGSFSLRSTDMDDSRNSRRGVSRRGFLQGGVGAVGGLAAGAAAAQGQAPPAGPASPPDPRDAVPVEFTLNGEVVRDAVDPRRTLLDWLWSMF